MMEKIKRHLFLVALGGGVAVIALAVAVVTYFGYVSPNAKLRKSYETTRNIASDIKKNPIFTTELVAEMAKQVDLRKSQYADILNSIRKEGAARKPLVAGVFPTTADSGKRLGFKNEYDKFLRRLMADLRAAPPPGVAEKGFPRSDEETAVYISPKFSFFRPEWVDRPEAPSMDKVREGQENLWLMEDVVGIIKKMNEDLRQADPQLKDQRPSVANSALKEIADFKIGYEYATLAGSKMGTGIGRYMPPPPLGRKVEEKGDKKKGEEGEKAEAPPRATTLPGRWSAPGFYQILPFKLVVLIESRYSGELLRRLKGTESFITVGAFRARPLGENSKETMGQQRKDYGAQTIDRLEVVGESLIFLLEGGRVTTIPAKPAAPAAAPAGKSK